MKIKNAVIALCLTVTGLARAIETDQFAAWTTELRDAAPMVETYFVRHIDVVLKEVNNRRFISNNCFNVAKEISEKLTQATNVPGITTLEKWLVSVEGMDRVPQYLIHWNTSADSIYEGYWRFKFITFGSTLDMYGIRLGADKIGHFAEIGMSYLKKVRKLMSKGKSYEEAVKAAIGYGVFLEKGIYGLYTSRIFSYADLEANYQGMKFYENLCSQGDHAHLSFNRDQLRWEFKNRNKFTLKPFINPNWDESFNINYFSPALHSMVLPRIHEKCELMQNPTVIKRYLDYYKRVDRNTNQVFLEEMIKKDFAPAKTFENMHQFCQKQAEDN